MSTASGGYAPQIIALLAGGLIASLGLTWAARTARGRALLERVRAPVAAVAGLTVVAGAGTGVWVMIGSLVRAARDAMARGVGPMDASGGPGSGSVGGPTVPDTLAAAADALGPAIGTGEAFLFGLLVGLPLSLPGLFLLWSDARSERTRRLRRRDVVPTKDDRRAYAEDLARQIRDVSPTPREVRGSIGGEGGRVLVLSGDVDAAEGERLTAALRRDLSELGFKRVEGSGGDRSWWTRV